MASRDDLTAARPPFVLTLEMDGEAFAAFEALRRRYYAAERNLVPAHVTLFHSLPGDRAREIRVLLTSIASKERPIEVTVEGARALSRGVAIFLASPRLHALHDTLAAEWEPWLSDQDRAGFRPHVTIQANVSEAEARRSIAEANAALRVRHVRGVGLHLWRYRDGPWEDAQLFRFG